MGRAITILSLLCAGCCGPVRGLYPPIDPASSIEIYVYNNHWHTGFILNRQQLSSTLQRNLKRFAGEKFVEIGWGDDGFYRAEKATSGLAMQAMFASRGAVLHVVGFDDEPASHYLDYHVDLYRIRVSQAGFARLITFLEDRFARNKSGDSIEVQPGLYGDSYFFAARGKYFFLHTCNNWTADGLRTTGFPISPLYAQVADNVGWQIRVFGRKYQSDVVMLRQ